MNRKLAFNFIVILCFVGVLHFIALTLKLYWSLPGFDKLLHASAGASIGFFYFVFRRYFLWLEKIFGILGSVFIVICFIGIGWEIFEGLNGIAGGFGGYWFDTVTDVIADIAGMYLAYWYITKKYEIHS